MCGLFATISKCAVVGVEMASNRTPRERDWKTLAGSKSKKVNYRRGKGGDNCKNKQFSVFVCDPAGSSNPIRKVYTARNT